MSVRSAAPAGSDGTGVFLIILSEAMLALVNTIVKFVHDWTTQKMMIVRNATDLCLCLGFALYFRYQMPSQQETAYLFVRSVAYIAFLSLFWVSLRSCLPLGDVIVFVMIFSPATFVLLSRALLGEKIPSRWPFQFCLCVIGALLINKPLAPQDGTCPATTALWPVSAAFSGGAMNFMSRNVKQVPPALACISNDIIALAFAMVTSAFGILGAGNGGLASLVPDQMNQNVALLILAGMAGCAGLMANVKGYQVVTVSAIATVAAYAAVPMGYAIQVFFFHERTDVLSTIGATLIVATNVIAIVLQHREEKKAEQKSNSYATSLVQQAEA